MIRQDAVDACGGKREKKEVDMYTHRMSIPKGTKTPEAAPTTHSSRASRPTGGKKVSKREATKGFCDSKEVRTDLYGT